MKKQAFIPAGVFMTLGILFLVFNTTSLTLQLIILSLSFIFFYILLQGPSREENFVWLLLGLLLGVIGCYDFFKQFALFKQPGFLFLAISLAFGVLFIHTFQTRSNSPHALFWPLYCSFVFLIIALSVFFTFSLWAVLLIIIGIMILLFQN